MKSLQRNNIVFYDDYKVIPKTENNGFDLFLRMELLKSVPKYLHLIRHHFSQKEVILLGIDIVAALDALEKKQYIHGDIKPDNLFIDSKGCFKLGDLGIFHVLKNGLIMGFSNYKAPEVFRKSTVYDHTADIYSLGIVIYRYMNNGYLPFMSDIQTFPDEALARRISSEDIKPPCNADNELSRIILKACAFKPEERYQQSGDLKADFIMYLNDKKI